MNQPTLFQTFFLGGFECSSHQLRSGKRLDLINATGHDRHVRADYERLRAVGIAAARDAVRWHLIETRPYHYDFASFLPMVQAARETGVQVIWDLSTGFGPLPKPLLMSLPMRLTVLPLFRQSTKFRTLLGERGMLAISIPLRCHAVLN